MVAASLVVRQHWRLLLQRLLLLQAYCGNGVDNAHALARPQTRWAHGE
jgi:hypothetical protein